MRQRVDSAAVASSSAAASAATARASVAGQLSPALPVSRLSLMQLAVVERQLVMQLLDIRSLTRIASTCAQLRGESLHKQAGKFISQCSHHCEVNCEDAAHASALFRTHVPVQLTLYAEEDVSADTSALIDKATFSRITELQLLSDAWSEMHALELLAQPWTNSITLLRVSSTKWLASPAVQHALFALSNLTSLHLNLYLVESYPLLGSAVSQATKATTTTLFMRMGQESLVRGLRTAPALRTLKLFVSKQYGDAREESIAPLIWLMPPTLTCLRLHAFFNCSPPRSTLKTMFVRLPQLHTLCTTLGPRCCSKACSMLESARCVICVTCKWRMASSRPQVCCVTSYTDSLLLPCASNSSFERMRSRRRLQRIGVSRGASAPGREWSSNVRPLMGPMDCRRRIHPTTRRRTTCSWMRSRTRQTSQSRLTRRLIEGFQALMPECFSPR